MVRTAFNTTLISLASRIQLAKPHLGVIAGHGPISLAVIAAGDANRCRVHVSASENLVYLLDAEDVFAVNRWTHVATTCDDTEMRMHVNGQLQEIDVSEYSPQSQCESAHFCLECESISAVALATTKT